jgi:formate dehydrogenase maturation protein FdhE
VPDPTVDGPGSGFSLFVQPNAQPAEAAPQTDEKQSMMRRLLNKDSKPMSKTPETKSAHACPSCGTEANVDISDPWRGLLHMNCPSCFKMWQEVDPTVARS